MNTNVPNLIAIVSELLGAWLFTHGGNLLNLARQPSITFQILGAQKALVRALKTKHATQKYRLIFHASLIAQATLKLKGMTILDIQYDILEKTIDNYSLGLRNRVRLVNISLDDSTKEMIFHHTVTILTPLIIGTFFGVNTLSSAHVSIVQITKSTLSSGGAWDIAKKCVKAGLYQEYILFDLEDKVKFDGRGNVMTQRDMLRELILKQGVIKEIT